jgi:hypothetical protein
MRWHCNPACTTALCPNTRLHWNCSGIAVALPSLLQIAPGADTAVAQADRGLVRSRRLRGEIEPVRHRFPKSAQPPLSRRRQRVQGQALALGVVSPEPVGADPEVAIGNCCHNEPDKRREFFIAMLAELNILLLGSPLLGVGGIRPSHTRFCDRMQSCVTDMVGVGHRLRRASGTCHGKPPIVSRLRHNRRPSGVCERVPGGHGFGTSDGCHCEWRDN